MTHWTSYEWMKFGVRKCKVIREHARAYSIEFPDGTPSLLPKSRVFTSPELALSDAKDQQQREAAQHISFWQRVAKRDIGVAS